MAGSSPGEAGVFGYCSSFVSCSPPGEAGLWLLFCFFLRICSFLEVGCSPLGVVVLWELVVVLSRKQVLEVVVLWDS